MAYHRIFVRTHLVIEVLLSREKFQRAGLPPSKAPVGRVADLPGHRDDLFSEVGDGDQALLELKHRVQNIALHQSLCALHLNFGLIDVDLGPSDVSLIAVVERDAQCRAKGP